MSQGESSTTRSGRLAAAVSSWSPEAVPAVLVLTVALIWAWKDGGYAETTWLPGTVFIVGLLLVLAVTRRIRFESRLLGVATLLLGGFVALNYLSILWAAERGMAWQGSNRTLLYFCVFVVFAARRWSARSAAVLIGGHSLVVAGMVALLIDRATSSGDPSSYFALGRFAVPIQYPNGVAGLTLAALWPAVLLASRRTVPVVLRGALLAAAGVLVETAILCQSRAILVAVPASAFVYLLLVPNRLRALLTLVPVAVAAGLAAPAVSHVYLALLTGDDGAATLADARRAIAWSVVGLFFAGTALAMVDRAVAVGARTVRLTSIALAALVLAGAGGGAIVGVQRYGNPVVRLEEGWRHFKSGRLDDFRRPHLLSGLGSPRYDIWRVAALDFARHPVLGIGSDNYAASYVRERRSAEEPLYPHSLELRLLSQNGMVGASLFAGFLALVGAAWWRRRRGSTPGERAVAVAAGMVFVHWIVHGSVDWLWEIPALGTAAFACLGLAVRTGGVASSAPTLSSPTRSRWLAGFAVLVALAAAASLVPPWVAARDVQLAANEWPKSPARAFSRLDLARRLNPLSDRPDVVGGVIASRLGDLRRERIWFERATKRNPTNWYSFFELGVVDSLRHRRAAALADLAAAARLNPSEPVIGDVRVDIVRGKRIDPSAIDREFMRRAALLQTVSGQTPAS